MLVSIIIPVYNVETYIIRCVESVLCQSYRQLEVIFVDDCSSDHGMELAKKYIQDSPKNCDLKWKYLKHEYNRGQAAARNTGLKVATGDYIYFMDSDDEITANCIETLIFSSENGRYDVVCGDLDVIGKNPLFDFNNKAGHYDSPHEIVKGYVERDICMIIVNKLIRRNVMTDFLSFKEVAKHEDELWSFKLVNYISSLRNVEEKTYIYYIRPNSVSTEAVSIKNYNSLKAVLEEMVALYNSGKIPSYNENLSYIQEKRASWMLAILRSHLGLNEKYSLFKNFYNLPIGGNGVFLYNLISMQACRLVYPFRRSLSLQIRRLLNR